MKKTMAVVGLVVLLAFGFVSARAADKTEPAKQPATQTKSEAPQKSAAAGTLDGRSFLGQIWQKGQQANPDTFVFKDGRFTSTACQKFGFKDAAYTTSGDGKNVRFRATTMNTAGAKMDWDGTITGDKLEGKAILNEPGKSPVENQFKAKITK